MNPKIRTALVWLALALIACSSLLAIQIGDVQGPLRTIVFVVVVAVLALLALVWWGRRQQASQLGGMAAFRQNKARLLQPGSEKTRFSDVGGLTEAKVVLGDVVDWLKAPERWDKAKVRPPRGVLLEGPPGTGKTLLARAVAGEANVKFFVASATEFVEMFIGVGPARMRDLFEAAAKNTPCVVFIDELDAIGRRRGSGVGHANEEREHALNELLVQMDGFEKQGRFVVIAASNRADVLDGALLRPGRFDMRVRVGELSEGDRMEVLAVHARGRDLAADVDFPYFARAMEGASGAVIEALVNDAAMVAMRRGRAGGSAQLAQGDLLGVLNKSRSVERPFGVLDQLLVESASQLAEPSSAAFAELELVTGAQVAGRVMWANAELLKVQPLEGPARLINRREVRQIIAVSPPEA